MKVGVIARYFKDPKVTYANLSLSHYLPDDILITLELCLRRGEIKKSDYIICPIYSQGDIQVGVTGKLGINEEPEQGMARELGEEIGIVPLHKNFLIPTWVSAKYNVYTLSVKDCIPVLDHQHGISLSTGKDGNRKVGCIIYGTKQEVSEFLDMEAIHVYKSEDNIVGVGGIKIINILKALQK